MPVDDLEIRQSSSFSFLEMVVSMAMMAILVVLFLTSLGSRSNDSAEL
jgi:type II secretory pathway pseudopilin PulG